MGRLQRPDRRLAAGRRRLAAAALLAAGIAILAPVPAQGATQRARLPGGEQAALVDAREIFLEAAPLRSEGLLAFSRRLTGGTEAAAEIARLNRNPKRLLAGVRYRVPYARLAPEWKLATVRALFPDDRATEDGWLHRSRGEELERIAEWFTGDGARAEALRRANQLTGSRTRARQEIRIPNQLLEPIFRWSAPAPMPAEAAAETRATPRAGDTGAPRPATAAPAAATEQISALLEFSQDERGKVALYRLRPGEALYSAVVVRFTGRLLAEDVNALALEIAARSGITDVTDIPIGFPVKIPFELLLPEFLPAGEPRRLEWEVERRLADQFRNEVRAKGLEGVTVILDAGHGGSDVGASTGGVWESLYVYDVMLRVKRRLEAETHARVHTTTRDGRAYEILDRDVLPYSRGHQVLTRPSYPITDATVGVHLRWYLANSLMRAAVRQGGRERVVFVSIHADSLHPSLRGATAYIPAAALTAGAFSKAGSVFTDRQEVREQPRVEFSLRERQQAEGLSRDLASQVLGSFRAAGLAVHPFQPVRDRIFRGRRAWVPAVLRYNAVPARMLLEVCNLANPEDRRLLQTRAFRDQVAGAIVAGLRAYFGERPGPS